MRHVIALLVLLLTGATGVARAEDGRWVAGLGFSQVNVTCVRTYTCSPRKKVTLSADQKIVSTPSQRVSGVCASGIGPLARCSQCTTNPPNESCTWEVVKK
jgi:hypothetical protein